MFRLLWSLWWFSESFALFTWNTIKYCLLFIPVIFLNPFDVAEKFVNPLLPEGWKMPVAVPPPWGIIALILAVVLAAAWAYHDLRRGPVAKTDFLKRFPEYKDCETVAQLAYLLLEGKRLAARQSPLQDLEAAWNADVERALARLPEGCRDYLWIFQSCKTLDCKIQNIESTLDNLAPLRRWHESILGSDF